jgi:hypothetical protein
VALRLVLGLLLLAVLWAAARPGAVDVERDVWVRGQQADPDAWADAMGLPEVFDPPEPGPSWDIDPGPHRAAIERIEAVLYRRAPADYGDAGAVESATARLASDLLAMDGLRGRRAGLELSAFAGRVGAHADVGYAAPGLVGYRKEWETLRARVFRTADWMRTAGADLDRIQDPAPPPPDPRTAAVLAEAARELERLLQRGRRAVEQLGEPRYDPEGPGRRAPEQIRAWYDWGERWRGDLVAALAPARALDPPPHPERESLHAASLRSLEEAAEMLRHVPDGAGMWPTPFRGAWESRFRAAGAALAEARKTLHAASLGREHAGS